MELFALLSMLFRFILVWRVFLATALTFGVWWALDQVFGFSPGWINAIPYVAGVFLGIFWYRSDPPARQPPPPVEVLPPRAAFLGAALCWAAALALWFVGIEEKENILLLPGAIFLLYSVAFA